jgi:hypothetical protein
LKLKDEISKKDIQKPAQIKEGGNYYGKEL